MRKHGLVPTIALILPTSTYRANDFLDAARRLGVDVTVVSERTQVLAGQMGDAFVLADCADPPAAAAAIAASAERRPLDAIMAVDDSGVEAAALAAETLGLAYNPIEAVRATRDKGELRARLTAAGIHQPVFELVGPGRTPSLEPPLVVKPRSLSASRGVIRVDDPADIPAALARTREIAAAAGERGPVIVESYVEGAEVAVEGLVVDGSFTVLAVLDKPEPLTGPYFEETMFVTPSRHGDATVASVVAATVGAVSALGLTHGPIHAELRLGPEGPVVIEVAARSIGGLCSRALRFGMTGDTLESLLMRAALGRPLRGFGREPSASGVMMLPIPSSGTFGGVEGTEQALAVPGISGLDIAVPVGRELRRLPEGDRYLGFLFASAATPDEVERALRLAFSRLIVRIG